MIKYVSDMKDIVMVEIGCYSGDSTSIFASDNNIKMIHAIDPWQNGYDDSDGASKSRPMELVEKMFDQKMAPHKDKLKKYKMPGDEAVDKFEDESLDLVYIDGNHQYEAVKNDIIKWLPKVKKTGYITGHDIKRDSVRKAVHEVLGIPHKKFIDTSWLFKVSDLDKD